jgi:hypothetical protein
LSSTQLRCLPLTARFASVLSHKGRAGSLWLLLTPDMRIPFRGAFQRPAYVKERKDCGAPIGRVRCAKWAASRRPACGDVFAALPRRLTSVSARASERSRSDETWPFQTPGGRGSEPLRLLRYACARCGGNRGFRPRLPRAPQAPHPKSREADGLQLASSWTRDACSVSEVWSAGISRGQLHPSPRGVGQARPNFAKREVGWRGGWCESPHPTRLIRPMAG